MSKIRVGVLMGGNSPEHEISLVTGQAVIREIDRERYEPFPLVLGRDTTPAQIESLLRRAVATPPGIDVVFIAMHGHPGEDGTVQAICEEVGVPYTGSDVEASRIGMDKVATKERLARAGLFVPISYEVTETLWHTCAEEVLERIRCYLGFPSIVKSPTLGSSVGVRIVENEEALLAAIAENFTHGTTVMVEDFIAGTEVSCGVLEAPDGTLEALPVIEIACEGTNFFDYDAKYKEKGVREIVPAPLSRDLTRKIQQTAREVHRILGCRGMSRTDMIVRGSQIYVLEINTIPGMTPTSLLPKSARVAGISFSELLHRIVSVALHHDVHREEGVDRSSDSPLSLSL